ncbi:MAG TPA: sulfatase-like hydrolase/transferase [Thermoanaerobaculia bacterium]|nr:sulfatase-like hydrolase/transferase [Thermoanaerobaculia bacterium]
MKSERHFEGVQGIRPVVSATRHQRMVGRRLNALRGSFCLLLSALCLLLPGCRRSESAARSAAGGPIIIISVDTLRADHLPAYGATAVRTPALDALAGDSIVFENAYAQVPLTLPSHVSMFTGKLPAEVNVRNNLGYSFDPTIPSLPTLFRDKGYETAAFVSAYVLRAATGLGAAFDHYDDAVERAEGGAIGDIDRSGFDTVDAAIGWLSRRDGEKPFFLFIHLFEPHSPYEPPEPFRAAYADSPYNGEIATADAAIGRLLDALRARSLYERSTIVFMSDHGEGLGDHGESEHGIFLYREAIHVPLFLKLPSNEMAGRRIADPVGLIDVFPTISSLFTLETPEAPRGTSLLKIAAGKGEERRIFSETMYPRIHLGWSDLASLVDERHHYIEAPRPELFDIVADPGEKQDVLAAERRVYAAMRKEMAAFDRALTDPGMVSAEDAAKLAALGYLGGTRSALADADLPDPKERIGDLERFRHASALLRSDEVDAAVPILEEIVERNPTFADAWTLIAKAHEQRGRTDEALAAYRKTIESAPMLAPGTALSIARLLLQVGRYDEAIEHADLAAKSHPAEARLVRARAYLSRQDHEAAERELQPALREARTRQEGMVIVAQIRTAQRRFQEALEIVEGVAREIDAAKGPPLAMLSLVRADALARLGRLEEARTAFEAEVRDFPGNREAYIRLAALHVLRNETDEAERLMASMIRRNPAPSSYSMVVEAYRSLGRPQLARSWEQRALRAR